MKVNTPFPTRKLYLAVAIASSLSSQAFAQESETSAPAAEEQKVESIQVTGSRVSRDGYDTPTPVASMSEEDINTFANDPDLLEDKLMEYTEVERGIIEGLPNEALVNVQLANSTN